MVWIPHFRDFIYIPLSSRPNILFPLLMPPGRVPLAIPLSPAQTWGRHPFSFQLYSGGSLGPVLPVEIVNRVGIVWTVGTQPWLPLEGLQQLTCSQLRSHFWQKCRYCRQDPHVPCHTLQVVFTGQFSKQLFCGNILWSRLCFPGEKSKHAQKLL